MSKVARDAVRICDDGEFISVVENMREELRGLIARVNASLDADALAPTISVSRNDAIRIAAALDFNLAELEA